MQSPPVPKVCEHCHFWVGPGSGQGECRRYPPEIVAELYTTPVASFPRTAARDWCGEWRLREGNPPGVWVQTP